MAASNSRTTTKTHRVQPEVVGNDDAAPIPPAQLLDEFMEPGTKTNTTEPTAMHHDDDDISSHDSASGPSNQATMSNANDIPSANSHDAHVQEVPDIHPRVSSTNSDDTASGCALDSHLYDDELAGCPILEATLVEEEAPIKIQIEPSGPIFDAVLEPPRPWWSTHQRPILAGLFLVICILIAAIIASQLKTTLDDSNDMPPSTLEEDTVFIASPTSNDDTTRLGKLGVLLPFYSPNVSTLIWQSRVQVDEEYFANASYQCYLAGEDWNSFASSTLPSNNGSTSSNFTAEVTYAIADVCGLDFQSIMNEVDNTLKSGLISATKALFMGILNQTMTASKAHTAITTQHTRHEARILCDAVHLNQAHHRILAFSIDEIHVTIENVVGLHFSTAPDCFFIVSTITAPGETNDALEEGFRESFTSGAFYRNIPSNALFCPTQNS